MGINKKILQYLTWVVVLLMPLFVSAKEYKFDSVETKTFNVITKILYKEKKYTNASNIKLREEPVMFNEGPDKELVSLISSLKANDYNWWLNLWDNESRLSFSKANKEKENFSKELFNASVKALDKNVSLSRWIVLRNYVLIGYEVNKQVNAGKQRNKEYLVSFVLQDGKWRISYNFMNSKIFKAIYENRK